MNRREFLEDSAAAGIGLLGYSEMKLDNLRAAGRAIREVVRA